MGKKDKVKAVAPTETKSEWFAVIHSVVDNITKIKIIKYNTVGEATEKRRVPSIIVTRDQLKKVVTDLLP